MTAQQTPQDRLADAISGERRDWHRVEVETDDLAAVLATIRATPQESTWAEVRWTAADVSELRPGWTAERAADFLADNESNIRDRMTECGWSAIETLLDMEPDR